MIYSPEDFSSIQKSKKGRRWKHATLAAMWNEDNRAEVLKKHRKKKRKPRNSRRRNRGFGAGDLALGAELGCCSVDRTIQIQCILQFFST